MLDTEAVGLDVVGTLWIFAFSLFAMQMTIPITMFHGFPFRCYCIFLFIAVLDTEAVGLDVVGTPWIFALSLFAMQMTIPITMFHGFPFA